jgi:hypothetical protein
MRRDEEGKRGEEEKGGEEANPREGDTTIPIW